MILQRYLVRTLFLVVLLSTPQPARSLEGVTSIEQLLTSGPADNIRALIKAVHGSHETLQNMIFLFRLLSYDQFNFAAYWEVSDAKILPIYYASIISLATPESLGLALRHLLPLESLLSSSERRAFLLEHLLDPTIDYPLGLPSLVLTYFTVAERVRILRHINEHQRHSLQSVQFLFDLIDGPVEKGIAQLAEHNLWELVDGAFFPSLLCHPEGTVTRLVNILAKAANNVSNDLAYYRLLVLKHMSLSAALKLTIDHILATVPTTPFREALDTFFGHSNGAGELQACFLHIRNVFVVSSRLQSTFALEHLALGQRKQLPAPFMLPLILETMSKWPPSRTPSYVFRDLLSTLSIGQIRCEILSNLPESWIESYFGDAPHLLGHWIRDVLPLSAQLRWWRAKVLHILSASGMQRYRREATIPGVSAFYTNLVRSNGRLFLAELIERVRQVLRHKVQLSPVPPHNSGGPQPKDADTPSGSHPEPYSINRQPADGTPLAVPRGPTLSTGRRRGRGRIRGRGRARTRQHDNGSSDGSSRSSDESNSIKSIFGEESLLPPPQWLAARGEDGTIRFNCDGATSSLTIKRILRLWQGWLADLALHGQPLPCVSSTLRGILTLFVTPKALDVHDVCMERVDGGHEHAHIASQLAKALRHQLFIMSVPLAVFAPGAPCTMPGSPLVESHYPPL